jgi:spermidine synthase
MRAVAIEQNNATGEVSYWQGRDHQSHADRDGISLAAYIHVIHGFLAQAGAKKVLMIGAAGGTLATMLHRSGVEATLVDINRRAFAIARDYFYLPDAVTCHVADGVAFLRKHDAIYDAIVLDAFDDDKIPPPFWTRGFFALAKRRLRRGGLFAVNITVQDDDDDTPDRFCKLMKRAWRDVRLLDTDGYVDRNAVAVAGHVRRLKPPRLKLRPRRKAKQIAKEMRGLGFRRLR